MREIWNEKCVFSPSLICLDMCYLMEQINELQKNGIKMIHIDILDGYFSPSMPLGFETVKQLREKTNIFFDCHVMTEKPDFFIDQLISIGVDHICFHIETCSHIDGMLKKIKKAGILAGIALKPSTSLYNLEYIIEKCDSILLMLINPGYASNKKETQISYSERKIYDTLNLIKKKNLQTKIILDGRISKNNINKYGKNIADIFVCGSTCINKNNIDISTKALFKIKEALLN